MYMTTATTEEVVKSKMASLEAAVTAAIKDMSTEQQAVITEVGNAINVLELAVTKLKSEDMTVADQEAIAEQLQGYVDSLKASEAKMTGKPAAATATATAPATTTTTTTAPVSTPPADPAHVDPAHTTPSTAPAKKGGSAGSTY
jgi:urocanate hydratase